MTFWSTALSKLTLTSKTVLISTIGCPEHFKFYANYIIGKMSVMENVHTIHRNLSGTGIRFPNHSRNATAPLVHKARVIKLPFQMNLLFYTKKRSIDETKTQLKVTTETENVVFPLKKTAKAFPTSLFFPLSLSCSFGFDLFAGKQRRLLRWLHNCFW